MNDLTTLERVDVLTGNIKGLVNVITRIHEKDDANPWEAWDVYNETHDLSKALFWYVDLLNEAVREAMEAEDKR